MPLIKMRNTKPNSDDIVWISFTATSRGNFYKIQTKTQMGSEWRYRGNGSSGKFMTSDELQDHIEEYIYRKEGQGFIICG